LRLHGDMKWVAMVGTLGITEMGTNVAYDPFNQVIIAGTQDNGSIEQVALNSHTWNNVSSGDGNFQAAAADKTLTGQDIITRYNMANNYGDQLGQKPCGDPDNSFVSSFQRRQFAIGGGTTPLQSDDIFLLDPTKTPTPLNGIQDTHSCQFVDIPYTIN